MMVEIVAKFIFRFGHFMHHFYCFLVAFLLLLFSVPWEFLLGFIRVMGSLLFFPFNFCFLVHKGIVH